MRRLLYAFLLVLPAAGDALASQTNAGNDTAEFLRVGAGARALGMGEAYGPIAEGPEAIYWNPAGLAQARRPEVSYTRTELYGVIHHDFMAYAHPVALVRGTLAVSYTRLSQEALPVVTNANLEFSRFTPHSDAFAIGYAHSFDLEGSYEGDRDYFHQAWETPGAQRPFRQQREAWAGTFMVGFALKGISEHLYDRSANAVALDGGAIFRPVGLEQLSLSATFHNAFGQEKFDQENFLLPVEFTAGAAYDQRWWQARLVPALEVVVPYFGNPYAKAGVEYSRPMGEGVTGAVRMGFKSLTVSDLDVFSGFTFGLGLQYKKLVADFAFEPMGDLGALYRFTVGWKW
ncbi:MAG: hypothetical protein HY077_09725 [Elusimicrobia bacterium]|nr:hypothetical protein [Elusimicrobiota bacterium]